MIKTIQYLGSAAAIAITSTSVSATYPYYDVDADVGTYSPIALGQNITLSACNTVFHSTSAGTSFNVCDLTDLYDFRFTWKISQDGQLLWKKSYKNNKADNGLALSLATGPDTLFSTVGNYVISLVVKVRNDVYVELPNNGWGQTGDNGRWRRADSGNLNIDKSTGSYTIAAASVPEPAAALLLLPGLWMIRRREQKRRAQSTAA